MIVAASVLALATASAATDTAKSTKPKAPAHKSATHKSSTAKSSTSKSSTAKYGTAKPGVKSASSKSSKAASVSTCPKGNSAKAKNCRLAAGKSRKRGQQSISADRAREIQEALIRAHYLDGEPSGVMDQKTKDALVRFQNDNGWQSKVVPDSRALIKLGLGPSREGLLNPDSAALATPKALGTEKEIPGGH